MNVRPRKLAMCVQMAKRSRKLPTYPYLYEIKRDVVLELGHKSCESVSCVYPEKIRPISGFLDEVGL